MIFTKFCNLLGFLIVSIYLGYTSTIHSASRPDILFINDPRPLSTTLKMTVVAI
ncbi:MAG: hypothetical protein HXX09_05440 [Bacteroidetes bacterium]|nr:hypothetical protein [Bacteroidota bacterium]